LDELRELGECEVVAVTDAVPEFDALVPTECHLAWDVTLVTKHGRDAIEDVFIFVIDDMTLDIQDLNAVAEVEAAEVVETVVAAATPVEAAGQRRPQGRRRHRARVPPSASTR
jgi:two-component system chemotaxis sensor kinase CheA